MPPLHKLVESLSGNRCRGNHDTHKQNEVRYCIMSKTCTTLFVAREVQRVNAEFPAHM
jgi:hypothetical protein